MKRKSIWMSAVGAFLVVTTLAYQNCSNKKFANVAGENVLGVKRTMDSGGTISGDVDVVGCDGEDQVGSESCPSEVTVKFYAVNGAIKTFIGDTKASQQLQDNGDGTKSVIYVFSFKVDSKYKCDEIEAYVVDPITSIEIKTTIGEGYIVWGGLDLSPECGGGSGTDPLVKITGQAQDQRLARIDGICANGAPVVASGDLLVDTSKNASCASGKFSYCGLLSKSTGNQVVVKQSMNSKTASDTVTLSGIVAPVTNVSLDSFGAIASDKKMMVSGKCNPGASMDFILYNSPSFGPQDYICPSSGTYSVQVQLVNPKPATDPSYLTFRAVQLIHTTPSGNTEVRFSPDNAGATPSCAITSVAAHASICSRQAGHVTGSCTPYLPVYVTVNGKSQTIAYCSSAGSFTAKNVLLENLGSDNTVSVRQVSPYGKSCDAAKVIKNF